MRVVSFCALIVCAAACSTTAAAQVPALSTLWETISDDADNCIKRGEEAMRQLKLRRIGRVGESVFADTPDNRFQMAIRCPADHKMFFVVVAGGKDNKAADVWGNRLKDAYKARAKQD